MVVFITRNAASFGAGKPDSLPPSFSDPNELRSFEPDADEDANDEFGDTETAEAISIIKQLRKRMNATE
jgi:hypothetical protein